jgi:hypothetical protein
MPGASSAAQLSLTADTYTHVLSDGRELDLDVLLASR